MTYPDHRASRTYSFPGGIAGKLGDRFEAKWAVKKLFEVLRGQAEALKFEFLDPLNHGVEFWLKKDGRKEWYQAKKQNTQGNWTIRRLEQEGVLSTAHAKLSSSASDLFIFVSETPAKDLSALARRATTIEFCTDFLACLTDDEKIDHFPALQRIWESTPERTFEYLRRICPLVESEFSLDTDLKLLGGLCFSDPHSRFYPLLREYLENNFNRELTTEIVRREVIESGFLTPRSSLDPTLRERITSANQRYLDSYVPFDAGGIIIPRLEAKECLELLDAEGGPTVVLLTGNAGTGKSGVVRQVLAGLQKQESVFLAFRVDNRLRIDSSAALGQALYEERENPIITLQALAPDGTAILFIDQIDAISEISGRTGAIREVVFEIIRFAQRSKKIRIVAACRSYDLTNDRALRELEKDEFVKRIEVAPLDWAKEIEPLLRDKDIPIERITPKQRQLLSLPLNLALFLETSSQGEQALRFQSTADLFDRLLSKKQRDIRNSGISLMPALTALAARMSQDQSLDAPDHVLDLNTRDLLATEHLIVHQNGCISFFHESLFDYAFARNFVAERRNLADLLRADEQHLFRRTQVRQILAMYRQDSGAGRLYLAQLRELLTSRDVRYHLKDAVARWLGGVEAPTEAELDTILRLDAPDGRMPALVRIAVYPQSDWLPVLLRRGLITIWLNSGDPERRDDALSILRNATKMYPAEVAKILRDWWQGDSKRGMQILGWFSWLSNIPPGSGFLQLHRELIRSKPEGLYDREGFYDRHALSAWVEHDPDAAGELLLDWFETWFALFPDGHPFDRNGQDRLEYHWLEELQKQSSTSFLKFAVPVFSKTIRCINLTNAEELRDYTWQTRYDRDSLGSGRFLSLLRKSFADLAKNSPPLAIDYLTRIDPASHPAALFLWLETIGVAGESLCHLLPPLLPSDRLFDVGPNGAAWLSFARAAKAALPHLFLGDKTAVEACIMNHWPELNRARNLANDLANGLPEEGPFWSRKSVIRGLQWNGYEQWCCLKAIPEEALSPAANQRLALLNRKFWGKKPGKPNNPEAYLVPPPIGTDRSKRMSDFAWLNAMAIYREDGATRRSENDSFHHTGTRGLASLLCERAKENPERFAKLLCRLPSNTDFVYFNEILNGLAVASPTVGTLVSAIRYAHSLPGHPCCEGIVHIIQKHPETAKDDDVFAILGWYVEHGPAATDEHSDPRRTQELIVLADHLVQRGGFVQTRSGYRDRGTAIEALAAVIWDYPERLEEGISLLQRRIKEETLCSIRCFLGEPIYSVLRHDTNRAAELLRHLIVRPAGNDLLPLTTYTGVTLLYYILHNETEIGPELLELLLTSKDEEQRLLGAFHLFREAFYHEVFSERADALAEQSDRHRKLAASTAANHLPHAAYRVRAEVQLAEYFNDPVKEVRAEAASCFGGIREGESIDPYRPLMRTFIQSQAFGENNFQFFLLLKETNVTTTEEVILAAERILDLVEQTDESSAQPRRHREMHYLDELLLREYRATDDHPEFRKRILDILDKMLSLGLYGTDKIIQEHERI